MKFRIKHVRDFGYYPQVQIDFQWHTINTKFFDDHNLSHCFKTESEAVNRCKAYKRWATALSKATAYKEIQI